MLSSGLEPQEEAFIILYQQDKEIAQSDLDAFGQFRLNIQQQVLFDLHVKFPKAQITVPQLSIQ